ncbi:MAG: aldehyde dehydrogenase family protein [Alphaproteobacteria bacterium]|nr:aldehyde dehydrogenase family protein [Alphaproteobacteria bacterium]
MTNIIDDLVNKARKAQADYERNGSQSQYHMAAKAVCWALMEENRNKELSMQAVQETGLGNVADKITKNHRKTLGLLRDILDAKTYGVMTENQATGITQIARAVGVVGAIVPSTNPVATPTNNIANALATGNAIIISPSPKGGGVCQKLIGYIHQELKKINLNPDLVQMLPLPPSKELTQSLLETVDVVVATGSQNNIKRAYQSGTPAFGVGSGNVCTIIDESADLTAAAQKIAASKTFDNATSCSSENGVILLAEIYDAALQALQQAGGYICNPDEVKILQNTLRQDGQLNRFMMAQDIDKVCDACGFANAKQAKFLVAPEDILRDDAPMAKEKMALVISVYKAKDFDEASIIAKRHLDIQGAGHSLGLHTTKPERAIELGKTMPTCRVIVNQAHCFATGGSFNNGMKFSLSMGCGSWGGNVLDDNLHYRHFMNITKIVHPIKEKMPELQDMFADYWQATQ